MSFLSYEILKKSHLRFTFFFKSESQYFSYFIRNGLVPIYANQDHSSSYKCTIWSLRRCTLCTARVDSHVLVWWFYSFFPLFLPLTSIHHHHHSAPIAYPIAKILDYVLGAGRHQTYKKAELKSFLQFHRTGEEPLRDEELVILNGVLELNTKEVERIMTPLRVSFLFFCFFVVFVVVSFGIGCFYWLISYV